ncbi:chondroitin sulfate proteoglycan 5-like [Lethenteron reissneri]|uniref:chondroitin sulfate proteoglycan 5-like n=1 Tax=Lethenteron reissneri TaxID=7753 RepID=UPI002AB71D22|nr:chondroitin sulfate proteoglycan 5-like [Lethenteron reissneri]
MNNISDSGLLLSLSVTFVAQPGDLASLYAVRASATQRTERPRRPIALVGHSAVQLGLSGHQKRLCDTALSCPPWFECIDGGGGGGGGRERCTSLCTRGFCRNGGSCSHHVAHRPQCSCPIGDHYWFMGARCDVRMTTQNAVGIAAGAALGLVTLTAMVLLPAARRFQKWSVAEEGVFYSDRNGKNRPEQIRDVDHYQDLSSCRALTPTDAAGTFHRSTLVDVPGKRGSSSPEADRAGSEGLARLPPDGIGDPAEGEERRDAATACAAPSERVEPEPPPEDGGDADAESQDSDADFDIFL